MARGLFASKHRSESSSTGTDSAATAASSDGVVVTKADSVSVDDDGTVLSEAEAVTITVHEFRAAAGGNGSRAYGRVVGKG